MCEHLPVPDHPWIVIVFSLFRMPAHNRWVQDLPLQIHEPSTTVETNSKVYKVSGVSELSHQLLKDIKGLTEAQTFEIAENGMISEENLEKVFRYTIVVGEARMSTFEILTKKLDYQQLSFKWRITEATVAFETKRRISESYRPRSRGFNALLGIKRHRRHSSHIEARGATTAELSEIQNKLTQKLHEVGQQQDTLTN